MQPQSPPRAGNLADMHYHKPQTIVEQPELEDNGVRTVHGRKASRGIRVMGKMYRI
jgi:hypothetical protein